MQFNENIFKRKVGRKPAYCGGIEDGLGGHHTTTWWVRPPRVAGATAGFEADMGLLVGRLDGVVADMEVSCGC